MYAIDCYWNQSVGHQDAIPLVYIPIDPTSLLIRCKGEWKSAKKSTFTFFNNEIFNIFKFKHRERIKYFTTNKIFSLIFVDVNIIVGRALKNFRLVFVQVPVSSLYAMQSTWDWVPRLCEYETRWRRRRFRFISLLFRNTVLSRLHVKTVRYGEIAFWINVILYRIYNLRNMLRMFYGRVYIMIL